MIFPLFSNPVVAVNKKETHDSVLKLYGLMKSLFITISKN